MRARKIWLRLACIGALRLVVLHKVLALLDVLVQLRDGGVQQALLVGVQRRQAQVLFDAVAAQLERRREVCGGRHVRSHVRALDHVRVAVQRTHQRQGEPGASVGHRQRGRTGAGLGLDHLGAGLLDALGQRLDLVIGELDGRLHVRQQRDDGDTCVRNGRYGRNERRQLDLFSGKLIRLAAAVQNVIKLDFSMAHDVR